jgi:hypothetical protein
MFKEDYVLRKIKSLIKLMARTLLKKDTVSYELPVKEKYTESDNLHKQLLEMIKQGQINEAENLLYDNVDFTNGRHLELALDFYERLNDLDDEFLEKNNFSRQEIEQGLEEIAQEFGLSI